MKDSEKTFDDILTDVSLMVGNGDDDTTIHIHVENVLDREMTSEERTKVDERIELMRS